MPELSSLIQVLGPTGAILAIGIAGLRGIWPWLRDQYFARQVAALEKLVVYMEGTDRRLDALEGNVQSIQTATSETRQDLSAVFILLKADQPSRPRRASVASAGTPSKGGSRS